MSIFIALLFVSCSGLESILPVSKKLDVDLESKYNLNKSNVLDFEKTIDMVVVGEAEISDWYDKNPVAYLRATEKMNNKDIKFFQGIMMQGQPVTDKQYKTFISMLNRYVASLPRDFELANANIKDPKGFVDLLVSQADMASQNPSNHIKNNIATIEEWNKILKFHSQKDLSENDRTVLRKMLNKFMEKENFFEESSWNVPMDQDYKELLALNAKENKTKRQLNNVNAKALVLAYPGYFSKLSRWK